MAKAANEFQIEPELLDTKQLAIMLNLNQKDTARLQKTGVVPVVRVPGMKGKKRMTRRSDALAFIASLQVAQPEIDQSE